MAEILELSNQELKITIINKGANGQNRQHERTDGEYKLRDGNSRKASYSHAKLSGGTY